jgi:hypothetical protein
MSHLRDVVLTCGCQPDQGRVTGGSLDHVTRSEGIVACSGAVIHEEREACIILQVCLFPHEGPCCSALMSRQHRCLSCVLLLHRASGHFSEGFVCRAKTERSLHHLCLDTLVIEMFLKVVAMYLMGSHGPDLPWQLGMCMPRCTDPLFGVVRMHWKLASHGGSATIALCMSVALFLEYLRWSNVGHKFHGSGNSVPPTLGRLFCIFWSSLLCVFWFRCLPVERQVFRSALLADVRTPSAWYWFGESVLPMVADFVTYEAFVPSMT